MIKLRTFVVLGSVLLTTGALSAQNVNTTSEEERRAALTEAKSEIQSMTEAMEISGKKSAVFGSIMKEYNDKVTFSKNKGLSERELKRVLERLDEERDAEIKNILSDGEFKRLQTWRTEKEKMEAEIEDEASKPTRPVIQTSEPVRVGQPVDK